MNRRRCAIGGGQQPDLYDGCLTLEFTETVADNVRPITANNNNVTTYIDYIVIDGVLITPTKNYQHTFSAGRHKIGWKFNTTIIYNSVFANTSPSQSFSSDLSLVTIPPQITEIQSMAMYGRPAYRPMQGVICHAATPPTAVDISISNWYLVQSDRYLSVPSQSVDAYKAAEGWSQYASQIIAIPT